eukprot:1279553-Lingulodinium_polyedra.AAC.1
MPVVRAPVANVGFWASAEHAASSLIAKRRKVFDPEEHRCGAYAKSLFLIVTGMAQWHLPLAAAY